jgi:flavorubredoxin
VQIKVVEADETFFDECELDCGDVNLSIFEMETDHSDDSTFIYVKEDKVLFVGDAYSKDYHHGEPHYTKEKLNKLIEMIKKLDINLIIHGHDEVLKKEELLENLKLELFQLN